jgi:ketosteroid isomerase-like protein
LPSEAYAVVRRIHERFGAGDREAWRADFAGDVEWDMSHTTMPGARVYRGHAGVEEFFVDWLGTWEDYEFELRELIDVGESVVIAFRQRGRGKGSGIEIDRDFYGVYDVRAGKVVRFRAFDSRDEALSAAGPP